MTEEEIRPIAENYVEEYCHCSDGEYTDGSLVCAGIGTALIVSRQLEKRIAELEATCNKWFEHLKNREEELLNELNNQNAKYNKQIAELEKENAELKDEIENDRDLPAIAYMQGAEKQKKKDEEQLTKAKEIIKEYMKATESWNYDFAEVLKCNNKAEQFLNEVEK